MPQHNESGKKVARKPVSSSWLVIGTRRHARSVIAEFPDYFQAQSFLRQHAQGLLESYRKIHLELCSSPLARKRQGEP